MRRKFNINDKIVIGFAGWFDWWDKLDITIDIQAELIKLGFNNTITMLVGDGPPMDSLKHQVEELGIKEYVLFTGAIDKKDVLNHIDVFDIGLFSHSNAFGSPVVLFEMMALGKCIVAPDLMPITDVIENDVNGLIFPVLDKQALINNITSIVNDSKRRKRIGRKAQEIVFKKYTWEKNVENILEHFQ